MIPRVEEGTEAFMRKRHDTEICIAAKPHGKAAAALPTIPIHGGGGRGGRGREGGGGEGRRRVLPKRLKSESGRHCLGVYMCALTVSS